MSPEIIAALRAGARAPAQTQGRAQWQGDRFVLPQAKQKGRGGLLTSLISEAGGAGGAAGGAALGTALLPGIGTVIGAGLGGFLGGTGGRVAENKVRDNRVGLGDALKEGSLAGVLSGLGAGYSAVKGAKAAATGVQEGSRLAQAGTSLRGTIVNPKVAASPSGASKELSLIKSAGEQGFKGSAKKQYEQLPARMKALSGQIDAALAQNTNTSSLSKLTSTIKQATKDLPQFINGDATYTKSLTAELRDLTSKFAKNNVTAAELQSAKSELSNKMGTIFTKVAKGSDLNAKEAARLSIWKGLDKHVTDIAPEVKALTSQQGKLYELAPGLKAASKKTLGAPFIGVKSQKAAQLTQGAQDLAGRALQKAGGVSVGGNGLVSQVLKQAKRQAPGNLVEALSGAMQPQAPQDSGYDGMDQMGGVDPYQMQYQAPIEQSPYPQEAVMADIKRDPKNASTYLTLYKTFNPENKQKSLNATQQQQTNNAQSALRDLSVIQSELQRDPSVALKSNLPGGSIAQRLTGSGEFEAARKNIGDVLARLRSGAAITDDEYKRYVALLPASFDSPKLAQQKISRLQQLLGSFDFSGGGSSYDETPQDLQSALMQAQGGY